MGKDYESTARENFEERSRHMRMFPTPSEKRFRTYLEKSELKWETQKVIYYTEKRFNAFTVDFFFPEYNVAIEIDGGSHTDTYMKDFIRAYILLKMGILVYVFSEDDVLDEFICMKKVESILNENRGNERKIKPFYTLRNISDVLIRRDIVKYGIE